MGADEGVVIMRSLTTSLLELRDRGRRIEDSRHWHLAVRLAATRDPLWAWVVLAHADGRGAVFVKPDYGARPCPRIRCGRRRPLRRDVQGAGGEIDGNERD